MNPWRPPITFTLEGVESKIYVYTQKYVRPPPSHNSTMLLILLRLSTTSIQDMKYTLQHAHCNTNCNMHCNWGVAESVDAVGYVNARYETHTATHTLQHAHCNTHCNMHCNWEAAESIDAVDHVNSRCATHAATHTLQDTLQHALQLEG